MSEVAMMTFEEEAELRKIRSEVNAIQGMGRGFGQMSDADILNWRPRPRPMPPPTLFFPAPVVDPPRYVRPARPPLTRDQKAVRWMGVGYVLVTVVWYYALWWAFK